MLRAFAALVWWVPSAPEGRGRRGSGLDKHGLWPGGGDCGVGAGGCRCSKHGFPLAGAPAPGGLGWWIRKTMLSKSAAGGARWPEGRGGAGRGEGSERDGCREVGVDKQGRVPPIAEG